MPQAVRRLKRPRKRRPPHQHAAARGYGWRWQQHTKLHKDKWPYCVHCLRDGKYNAGTGRHPNHVDHIIRATEPNDPQFYNTLNHQTLCHQHHSKKTLLEEQGRYDTAQDLIDRAKQCQ